MRSVEEVEEVITFLGVLLRRCYYAVVTIPRSKGDPDKIA